MLVPQRHIVQRAAGQRVVELGEPDEGGFVSVGVKNVNAAVGDKDSGDRARVESFERFGDQVGGRGLGPPWRGDDFQPGPNLMDTGPIEHHHVVGAFGGERHAGVHR